MENINTIRKLCADWGIALEDREEPKLQQGWEGKAKGMLQILWEQGFIDISNLKMYAIDGKKDAYGVNQPETSLKYLLGNCKDFEE